MPNLPLCDKNKTKVIQCAKSVVAIYNATSFLQATNAYWNNQKACSVTEYFGQTLLYGPMTDFMRDVGIRGKENLRDKLGEGLSALTYTFGNPEQISVYKEEIVFDTIQLIGNLGGTFSLFTGFSFFAGVGWTIRMIRRSWNHIKIFYRFN